MNVLKNAADNQLKGILGYTDQPVVSSDLIGNPHSSVVDINTGISLNDNEWGYSNRLVDLILYTNKLIG